MFTSPATGGYVVSVSLLDATAKFRVLARVPTVCRTVAQARSIVDDVIASGKIMYRGQPRRALAAEIDSFRWSRAADLHAPLARSSQPMSSRTQDSFPADVFVSDEVVHGDARPHYVNPDRTLHVRVEARDGQVGHTVECEPPESAMGWALNFRRVGRANFVEEMTYERSLMTKGLADEAKALKTVAIDELTVSFVERTIRVPQTVASARRNLNRPAQLVEVI